MSESKLENEIRDCIEERGGFVVKIHGSAFMAAGTPDLLACYKGHFLGIEVKFGKNGPSELQKAKVKLINQAGGYGIVTWDLQTVKNIMGEIDNG